MMSATADLFVYRLKPFHEEAEAINSQIQLASLDPTTGIP